MTYIKDLRERIQRLLDRKNKLFSQEYFLEYYPDFKHALDNFRHAHSVLDQVTLQCIELSKEEDKRIDNVIKELDEKIEKLRQKEMGIEVDKSIEQWFYNIYLKDCNFGYGDIRKNVKIVWLSKDEKFGIATKVGNSYWDSIEKKTKGSPSYNWAFRVMKKSYKEGNHFAERERRLTNKKKQEIIDEIYNSNNR